MKKYAFSCTVVFCVTTLLFSLALGANPMKSESGWFDFEECAFCKNLSNEPGLLEHATWENHPIENGMMNIVTVEAGYIEAMDRANRNINALGMKIQAGEVNPMSLKMCKRCQTFGMLVMSGVKMEEVRGDAAIVTLVTSDDETVVARLQDLARKDIEELTLLSGGAKEKHGH